MRLEFDLKGSRVVHTMIWSAILLLLFCGEASAQTTYFDNAGVDTSDENIVYFLMVLFFGVNFATPIAAWVYRNYIEVLLDQANERIKEVQQRISERISDAGRKLSDRMRA